MIRDTSKVGQLKLPSSQKSMDDDNPTIPVNRGAAGVYIPEPNEKERCKANLLNALKKYIDISGEDLNVFEITSKNGKVYMTTICLVR